MEKSVGTEAVCHAII